MMLLGLRGVNGLFVGVLLLLLLLLLRLLLLMESGGSGDGAGLLLHRGLVEGGLFGEFGHRVAGLYGRGRGTSGVDVAGGVGGQSRDRQKGRVKRGSEYRDCGTGGEGWPYMSVALAS